jgi:hypothetical protein
MNKGKKDQSRRSTGKKKPYRSPELTVHGDIRALTRAKGGAKSDGTGVPKTKTTGAA